MLAYSKWKLSGCQPRYAPSSPAPYGVTTNGCYLARYPEGLVEYYCETARTFMDLAVSQTILNFSSIRWIVPHAGGAVPRIEDRFIASQAGRLIVASKAAYSTRHGHDIPY